MSESFQGWVASAILMAGIFCTAEKVVFPPPLVNTIEDAPLIFFRQLVKNLVHLRSFRLDSSVIQCMLNL